MMSANTNEGIRIRCDYPGGNVKVASIDEARGVVEVAPDMRDSSGRWFHWDFTVSGAAGRTLHFRFPDGFEYLSSLGPAVRPGGGAAWGWLHADGTRHEPANAFDYTLDPGEDETRFAVSIPYSQRDWDAFLASLGRRPDVRPGVLCRSQGGRRDTELLRIPCAGAPASWLFVFIARQHACETSASPVLEGVVQGALADTPEGRWVRENADCLFVPFMDKDGVEDGDQGKNRIPHDHNRDYAAGRYASVRALKTLVGEASCGRRLVFLDLHSPHVRSLPHCPEQDQVFSFGSANPVLDANWNRFRRHWADAQRGGALAYDGSFDIHAGEGYDKQCAEDLAHGLMSARDWAQTLPGCFLATTCEFGYSLCGGVFSFAAARELGRNLLRAVQRTATEAPFRQPDP